VIERLDMSVFEQSYSIEGGELYAPQLMLGVWLSFNYPQVELFWILMLNIPPQVRYLRG
jgi:hypothetical protein